MLSYKLYDLQVLHDSVTKNHVLSYKFAAGYIINPRRACAAKVTVVGCVCLCVCLSTPQLTSRWFVCPRNDATDSSDNENQFNCMDYSENAPLLRSGVICDSRQCVRPYLVVATKASLLVTKANNKLSTTRNTSQ